VSPPSLWRNRDFNIYWVGQALSVLGDAFSLVATPLLVFQATGSVAAMGLLTATLGVGYILAGLFSGVLVDRFDRRRLMIACDLARTVLWGSVPLVWFVFGPTLSWLFVCGFFGALLGNTFQVACITAVANLARRDQVTEANGRLQATFAAMTCVGPMLSGWICHRSGPVVAIGVDALSFLASSISLMFIRLPQGPRPEGKARPVAELLAGAQFLWNQPVLRAVALLLAATNLVMGARNDLLIYRVKHTLLGSDDDVGWLFAVAAVGALAGGLIAPWLRRRVGFSVCWLGPGFLLGVTLWASGSAPSLSALALLAAGMAFGDAVRGINSMSFRQEVTPDHLLGRVTSAFWCLINVTGPIGAAATTQLAERQGSGVALTVVGVGTLTLSTIGLFTAIRRAEAEPGLAH
jgi:MFS family permease